MFHEILKLIINVDRTLARGGGYIYGAFWACGPMLLVTHIVLEIYYDLNISGKLIGIFGIILSVSAIAEIVRRVRSKISETNN